MRLPTGGFPGRPIPPFGFQGPSASPPNSPAWFGYAAFTNEIDLSWTDRSSDEDAFSIERSADGVTGWTEIGTPAANATAYSDTGLTPSTDYYYRIRSRRGASYSDYSGIQGPCRTCCAQPTSLTATAISAEQINLAWLDNATDEDGYTVERSLDNLVWATIITLGAGATSYSVTSGLTPNTLYYWRVRAARGLTVSTPSNTASATTTAYYVKDRYTTTQAAPAPGLRTTEPGPGVMKYTDTGSKVSIPVSGTEDWASPGIGAGNPGSWENTIRPLVAGFAIGVKISFVTGHPNARLGFSALQSGNIVYGLDTNATNGGYLTLVTGGLGILIETLANALSAGYHNWWVIQRTGGGFFGVIDNRLVAATRSALGSNAYAAHVIRNNVTGGFTRQGLSVVQLADSAWVGAFPTAIMELALTSPAAGSYAFTHEAKFPIEFETNASTAIFSIKFQQVDANNYWELAIVAGAGTLTQYIAGIPTVQATGSFAANTRFVMNVSKDNIWINSVTNSSSANIINFSGTYTPAAGNGTVVVTSGLSIFGAFKSTVPSSAQTELAGLL